MCMCRKGKLVPTRKIAHLVFLASSAGVTVLSGGPYCDVKHWVCMHLSQLVAVQDCKGKPVGHSPHLLLDLFGLG